jgi:hypothetical protein
MGGVPALAGSAWLCGDCRRRRSAGCDPSRSGRPLWDRSNDNDSSHATVLDACFPVGKRTHGLGTDGHVLVVPLGGLAAAVLAVEIAPGVRSRLSQSPFRPACNRGCDPAGSGMLAITTHRRTRPAESNWLPRMTLRRVVGLAQSELDASGVKSECTAFDMTVRAV